jgi:hypothetical protein
MLALGLCSCAVMATAEVVTGSLGLLAPNSRVEGGTGQITKPATERIANAQRAARVTATRDAMAIAAARPDDVRLQRRAAEMLGEIAGDHEARAQLASSAPPPETLLDRLVALSPCPGLADAGAAWVALGDDERGAETYTRASRQCSNPEAAVASAHALHRLNRCDDAITVLRDAWPFVHGASSDVGIEILDGVTECSDALTVKRNLAFVPRDVLAGYAALLDERERQAEIERRRAEHEQARQEAEARAQRAASNCESECSAASSSCDSACQGDSSCTQSCSALYHACRSGCGTY